MSTVKKQMPANQPWEDILLQVPIFQRTCLVSIQLNNSWKEKEWQLLYTVSWSCWQQAQTDDLTPPSPLPPSPLPPRSRRCLPNWLFIKVQCNFHLHVQINAILLRTITVFHSKGFSQVMFWSKAKKPAISKWISEKQIIQEYWCMQDVAVGCQHVHIKFIATKCVLKQHNLLSLPAWKQKNSTTNQTTNLHNKDSNH